MHGRSREKPPASSSERASSGSKCLLGKYNYPACLFLKPSTRRMGPFGNPDAKWLWESRLRTTETLPTWLGPPLSLVHLSLTDGKGPEHRWHRAL